jgi:Family of unknown function (DUF6112)
MTVLAAAAGTNLAAATSAPPDVPQVTPDTTAPGVESLHHLVNALASYALIAAVAAVIIGGISWALGERLGMERASSVGKGGVLAGFGLAFLVGAAAALVQFALNTGKTAAGPPRTFSDRTVVELTVPTPPEPGHDHLSTPL